MVSSDGRVRRRLCHGPELGVGGRDDHRWPPGEVLLASVAAPSATRYVLTIPGVVLAGPVLTDFLARVAPFGCPPPPSLIRAYSLPDSPYPSILLDEHADAPDGTGEAYRRFLTEARRRWMAALMETGPGLCPALGWEAGTERRMVTPVELGGVLAETGIGMPGVADSYLGRGLLLLAHPDLAEPWPTMMSLGGPTKARQITGREFPVWVDLAIHQPALLASPLLRRVEGLLAAA
jgi:hypothetical protein